MQAVSRPYTLAAAAVAATGAVLAAPFLAHQAPLAVRSIETKLVTAGDIGNILPNLFNDILSIPYHELEGGGIATVGDSFLFTGTWWVPSPTNVWGIDPGDPSHVALIDNFLPFSAFTEGFKDAAGIYHPGLNYEFAGFLAAELPTSASCDAATCYPMTPPDVITGSTQFDRDIGFFNSLFQTGNGENFGLFQHWFQVPLQQLIDGYSFTPDNPDATGIIDPSGPVHGGFGFDGSNNPFEAGTGPGDTMPWYGTTFHFNLFTPFQTYYEYLTQDPSTTGAFGTGVELPTFEGTAHSFENLLAGLIIDFDPYTAGSPACPETCDMPEGWSIKELVQGIYNLDKTNTDLEVWLEKYNLDPTLVNEPSQDQINTSVALLQTGIYNLNPEQLANVNEALGSINPALPALFANAGVYTDPNYLAYIGTDHGGFDPTEPLHGFYGGYNPLLVPQDLFALFTNGDTNYTNLSDLNLLWFLANPLSEYPGVADAPLSAAAEAPNLLSSVDPTALTTDLTNLLTSFGTTAGADALSASLADLSAQFAADIASFF